MAAKKKRHISPPYPFFGLEACVGYVEKFNKSAGQMGISKENALKYMDLNPSENNTHRAYSAMTNFGLISEHRSGNIKQVSITDLARVILVAHGENNPRKITALQAAALNYKIFRDLRNRWIEGLPDDNSIKEALQLDHDFSARAAKQFLPALKETFIFAKLGGRDIVSQPEKPESPLPEQPDYEYKSDENGEEEEKLKEFPILLLGDTAFVKVRLPLSEKNHQLIVKWLENNKEALTYSSNRGQQVVEDGKET